jgi:hypothetical protein
MQRLGYVDDELLAPEQVVAYQFRREAAATQVVPLEQTELGIAVPTFNEPLAELLDEVMLLQEAETADQEEAAGGGT